MEIKNIAFFISGSGTTFDAINKAVKSGKLGDTKIAVVVASRIGAAGIFDYAMPAGIPHSIIMKKNFDSDEEYGEILLKVLERYEVDFICLAGFRKKIPNNVVEKFRGRIINSHPGDTRKYGGDGMYGLHVHEAVLKAGEEYTMSTVHFVDEKYDHGKIIVQEPLKIPKGITAEKLQKKLLPIEWHNYTEALKLLKTKKF